MVAKFCDVHFASKQFQSSAAMFRGSRKKFGRDRTSLSMRLSRSQRSTRSTRTMSLAEDVTITDKSSKSAVKTAAPETKGASKEKVLVYRFVRRIMEKGARGLRTEFLSMKRVNNLALMRKFVQMNPKGKNRYKDVGCLDASRVKLLNCPEDEDYVHANYVSTPTCSRRFICTQAPLEKTCKDFWLMCIQDRVEFIVMLCNFFEKGARKCFPYYPTQGSLQFDDITVTYMGSTMCTFEMMVIPKVISHFSTNKRTEIEVAKPHNCIPFDAHSMMIYRKVQIWTYRPMSLDAEPKHVRFLCTTNAQVRITALVVERSGRRYKTKHLQWIDWPDRGVPPADSAIIQVLDIIKSTQAPIVVHCSAGVGRTGSFVMIQHILESLSLNQPIEDSDKLLLKLRAQRANTIQTDQQYLFVHQVLLNYFQESQLLDARWKPYLDSFTRDYNRLVF